MASSFILLLTSSILLLLTLPTTEGASSIGVCYGMLGDNLPLPSQVVDLYKSKQIGRMRLYEPNFFVFEALRKSGIHVIVGIPNEAIEALAVSYVAAEIWVNINIRPFWPDVIFQYIAVGNQAIPGQYAQYVLPAIINLHNALREGELWQRIKVSTAVSTSVMSQSYPPSSATFSEETISYLEPISKYLHNIGAPLLANVYPYYSYVQDPQGIWLPYALFLENSNVFTDEGLGYRNLFDATVDALYASLEKVGAPEVTVVVAETGWPSSGNNDAAKNWIAWLYNSKIVKHVLSSQGTPRRPGAPIETYLFSMFDEEEGMRFTSHDGDYFGLFKSDMTPVYPINFV